jgi:hypothetical protein
MVITRFLKASTIKELTILAAVVLALTGMPEKALADACTDACGAEYEQWVYQCNVYLGTPGYEYCLDAADQEYDYCISQC